jgi:hypothetical protein
MAIAQDYDDTGWIHRQREILAATKQLDDPAAWERLRASQSASNAEHRAVFGHRNTVQVSATTGEIPRAVHEAASHVGMVRISRGNNMEAIGSGTYLGSGLGLTCDHLAAPVGTQATFTLPAGTFTGRTVASDSTYDLAVIELSDYPTLPGLPLSTGDESIGSRVYPLGYSSGVLRGRVGTLADFGGPISDGLANWSMSAVPSFPGDSGGPLFDDQARIVGCVIRSDYQTSTTAVCQGRVQRFLFPWNAKLAAWQSAVAAGHNPWTHGSNWVQQCGPGGCAPMRPHPGTQISPGSWSSPRPIEPVRPAPQTVQGPKGDTGEPGPPGRDGKDGSDADDEAILVALFQRIKSDPSFRGEKGEQGARGEDAAVDYDLLAAEVARRLPPIHVQNYDRNNRLVDEEYYPVGTPIKLRHGGISGGR